MQSWLRGPKAFALAGVAATLLAGVLVVLSLSSQGGDAAPPPPPAVLDASNTLELLDGIPQQGAVLGRRDAPVTLVEYADLQCPYCANWAHEALPELVRDYVRPGKLRIEFRGLAFIGPDSDRGLRATLAAGEQRRLWHVLDLVYHHQGHENSGWLSEELLRQIGAAVPGLDTERMLSRGPAMTPAVRAAQAKATAAGINGTPSFQVGRTGGPLTRVNISSLDAGSLRPAIDAALATR